MLAAAGSGRELSAFAERSARSRRVRATTSSRSDWLPPQTRQRSRSNNNSAEVAAVSSRPLRRPRTALALLLEFVDAGALLGTAAGAAAVIVTEQVALAAIPLLLPLVALLAGRAALGLRRADAAEEVAEVYSELRVLAAAVRTGQTSPATLEVRAPRA